MLGVSMDLGKVPRRPDSRWASVEGFGGPGLLAAMPAAALDSRPYPSTPHARPQPLKEAPVTRGWPEWRDPDAGMDSSVTHASSKLQLVTDWGKMVRATLVP